MKKKKHTLTALEALERLRNTLLVEGYWQDVLQDVVIIETELTELAELRQMEQELNCRFKDIYHALKASCVIEFNGQETIAHAKGNKL